MIDTDMQAIDLKDMPLFYMMAVSIKYYANFIFDVFYVFSIHKLDPLMSVKLCEALLPGFR